MDTLMIILELQGYEAWAYNHAMSLRKYCTCMLRELFPRMSPDISIESWKIHACILQSSDVSPNAQHIKGLGNSRQYGSRGLQHSNLPDADIIKCRDSMG